MRSAPAVGPAAAVLLLLLAWAACGTAPAQAAPQDRLCRTGPMSAEPTETRRAGCVRAFCTPVGQETLCSCQRDADGDSHRFERWRGGQRVQAWDSAVAPIMGGGAFSVTTADVDGDGRPEWLVVRQQGASNGLGVTYQSLCVVWPGQPGRAPVCRDIQEWQSLTLLVREAGRNSCSLMDGAWEPGSEARRGPGTYAVGRLHRLQGQAWTQVPGAERRPVARRLLKSFELQRETLPQRNAQQLWYLHPAAVAVPCPGPMCLPPAR